GRRLHALKSLLVNDFLTQVCPPPAILFGPVDTHPATVVELAMPGAAALELLLRVRVVQLAVVPPVAGEMLFEPASELLAKRFIFCAKLEIHRLAPLCFATPSTLPANATC